MHYYEIMFYDGDDPKHWAFYIKSENPISPKQIKAKIERLYIGVDGLEQHHIDNIIASYKITADEYESQCGLSA